MRQALAGAYATICTHRSRLLAGAFYLPAVVLAFWALVVMLRSRLPGDADGLWVATFAHDILKGIPLGGWKLPGAPIYFPELSSMVLIGGLGFGVRASLLIYGACSWLSIGGGIYWGLRLGGVGSVRALQVAFGALLIYLLLHFTSGFAQNFEYPFSHGGALLAGFYGLLYLGHGFQRGFALRGWLVAVACLSLSCASDRALLAQFILPALCVVLMLWMLRGAPRQPLFWAGGLLTLAPVLGGLWGAAIRSGLGFAPGTYNPRYGLALSARSCWRLADDLRHFFVDRPSLALCVFAPLLFLGWRAASLVRARWRARHEGSPEELSADGWLACAVPVCMLSTLAAVIVANVWDGMVSQRYLLPLFLMPLAHGIIVAAPSYLRWPANTTRLFETALLLLLVLTATRAEGRTPRHLATMDSPRRACLDGYLAEQHLRAGYAEYWNARPPMLLGQSGVTIAEVTNRLQPKAWADNRFWYTRGFSPGPERPRFSFVIPDSLDEQWLARRFGPPRTEGECFGERIWVYDRPQDLEFRNYLRGGNALATGDDAGWWVVVGKGAEEVSGPGELSFGGKKGLLLQLPRVAANMIELASSTHKPLSLSFRRDGVEVSRQEVLFPSEDSRRLLALPAGLDMRTVDSVLVSGEPKVHYRVTRLALMWDPEAETIRQ